MATSAEVEPSHISPNEAAGYPATSSELLRAVQHQASRCRTSGPEFCSWILSKQWQPRPRLSHFRSDARHLVCPTGAPRSLRPSAAGGLSAPRLAEAPQRLSGACAGHKSSSAGAQIQCGVPAGYVFFRPGLHSRRSSSSGLAATTRVYSVSLCPFQPPPPPDMQR